MIISPDNFLYTDGKYVWTPERCSQAWKQAYADLEVAFRTGDFLRLVIGIGVPGSGKSTYITTHHKEDHIYFDATFCNIKSRKEIIRRAKVAKMPIDALFFDTPFEICVKRNKARSEDRKVPYKTMQAMYDKLKMPDYSEGFAHIQIIEHI